VGYVVAEARIANNAIRRCISSVTFSILLPHDICYMDLENLGNQMRGGYFCLKRSGIPSEQYALPEMFENKNTSGIDCGKFGEWS
jgi:hypothetical protein